MNDLFEISALGISDEREFRKAGWMVPQSKLIRQTSLMKMLKSRGPSTDPCGTPILIFLAVLL